MCPFKHQTIMSIVSSHLAQHLHVPPQNLTLFLRSINKVYNIFDGLYKKVNGERESTWS